MRIIKLFLVITTLLCVAGCGCGDTVPMRHLCIRQTRGPEDLAAFDIEVAPALLEKRTDMKDKCGSPLTELNLADGKPVRILIVPATQP